MVNSDTQRQICPHRHNLGQISVDMRPSCNNLIEEHFDFGLLMVVVEIEPREVLYPETAHTFFAKRRTCTFDRDLYHATL